MIGYPRRCEEGPGGAGTWNKVHPVCAGGGGVGQGGGRGGGEGRGGRRRGSCDEEGGGRDIFLSVFLCVCVFSILYNCFINHAHLQL